MSENRNLSLSLKLQRKSFVTTESIIIEVTLLNNSETSFNLEEIAVVNNSLHFFASEKYGTEYTGSLQSSGTRDGLRVPDVHRKPTFRLESNAKRSASVDLLGVLGVLPSGNYEIKGLYTSGGLWFVWSNKVSFNVINSTPVYLRTAQDSLRATSNTIRTAWINKEGEGNYVFIMENSQFLPANLKSNRRILKIGVVGKVYPSILASTEQDFEHVLVIETEVVKIATLQKQVLKDIKTIKLDVANYDILEPLLTAEDGTLHFAVSLRDNDYTVIRSVTCSLKGEIGGRKICRFKGKITKYCIIYDEQPRLHLTWTLQSGEIFYTFLDISNPTEAECKPKMLVRGNSPILDLQLSNACQDEKGGFQLLLNFVDYVSLTKLHSQLVNTETGAAVFHSFSQLPELKDLILLQTILDLQCRPNFLFQDHKGALWFKSFKSAKAEKVTVEGESYPGNIDSPVLLVSSDITRNYGIYLMYIINKKSFIFKKLESLE
jgi:hypothetical protein